MGFKVLIFFFFSTKQNSALFLQQEQTVSWAKKELSAQQTLATQLAEQLQISNDSLKSEREVFFEKGKQNCVKENIFL